MATSGVDLDKLEEMTHSKVRKAVYKSQVGLWQAQKDCETDRAEWLQGTAKARSATEGDVDWE